MIVVPPLAITVANLTSSTVAEPSAPTAYNSGTTYANGAFASDSTTHIAYQSTQAGNVNNTPALSPLFWQPIGVVEVAYDVSHTYGAGDYSYSNHRIYLSLQAANTGNQPLISPLWWEDVGPTLRYGMFDTLRNTATVGASPLTVVITPGVRIDTLAVLNVTADSVRVQMTSSGVSVYDVTATLTMRDALTWYDYFFKPFSQSLAYLFQNLPPYTNGVITATFTRAAGNVSCGANCVGTAVQLGTLQKNPVDGALNFSTIDRDVYGNSVLIPRRSVPKTTQAVLADSANIANIRAVRTALNAVPAVWAGLTDSSSDLFPSFLILGVFKEFTITITSPTKATLALELEEV